MNLNVNRLLPYLLCFSLMTACQDTNETPAETNVASNTQTTPEASTEIASYSGTVIETMSAGGYTYVHIDTGKETVWAAGPTSTVQVGEVLSISQRMPMRNFHSKSLNRDFDVLYFVDKLGEPTNAATNIQQPHNKLSTPSTVKLDIDIAPIDGGKTIAEILEQKSSLSGQSVKVRGKIVKYTRQVLGKDWIHIRDSSGEGDLTITTNSRVSLGDVVVAEGVIKLNRDFGFGYVYDVLMEDATVIVEIVQ